MLGALGNIPEVWLCSGLGVFRCVGNSGKKKRERQFCLGVRVVFIQEVEEQRRIKTIAG